MKTDVFIDFKIKQIFSLVLYKHGFDLFGFSCLKLRVNVNGLSIFKNS